MLLFLACSYMPNRGFSKIPVDDDTILMQELLDRVLARRNVKEMKGTLFVESALDLSACLLLMTAAVRIIAFPRSMLLKLFPVQVCRTSWRSRTSLACVWISTRSCDICRRSSSVSCARTVSRLRGLELCK